MILEIQTREDAPDQLQAEAAGVAEGFLTRISIYESYKEFFAEDICLKNGKLCQQIEEWVTINEQIVGGKIAKFSQTDPYWHQVNLFYLQMEGMRKGYMLKSKNGPWLKGK